MFLHLCRQFLSYNTSDAYFAEKVPKTFEKNKKFHFYFCQLSEHPIFCVFHNIIPLDTTYHFVSFHTKKLSSLAISCRMTGFRVRCFLYPGSVYF